MVGQLKAGRQELKDKLEEVPRESELKALGNALESAQKEHSNLEQELSELDQAQEELESEKQGLAEHSCPTDKSDEELSKAIAELKSERDRLGEERGGMKQHISDHESLLDEGECPTCHRTIEEEDQEEFQNRLDELRQDLESLEEQIGEVDEGIDQLETLRSELSDYLEKQERIREIDEELRSIQGERTEKLDALQEAQAEVESQASELTTKEALAEESQDLYDELDEIETQIEEEQGNMEDLRENHGKLEEREANLMSDVEELEGKIEEKEAAEAQAESYLEVVRYLKEYFIPTVQRIEQVMLQAIHDEFDRHFQRFFEMTIGDTELSAYIDESFSPVITEDGYEVPFDDLSGGEKTSLALAYRLALNLTVKKLSELDKTLLILDEPTDGFSREQVLNLCEVLDTVGCDQTILVSHEEEVKGFADHAYGVEKIARTSRITRL